MSLTTCPISVIGHLSTLPLHAHYAIHLPFAFHALAHPCFCPLLSTSLLLPTTLLLQASELNFCLSLLPPSILLIYSCSSSLKLILNISIFPFWFLLLDEKNIIIIIMYAFKSMCPPHFNMAGGGRGVKAILNEFSLQAKCELMIRSLS